MAPPLTSFSHCSTVEHLLRYSWSSHRRSSLTASSQAILSLRTYIINYKIIYIRSVYKKRPSTQIQLRLVSFSFKELIWWALIDLQPCSINHVQSMLPLTYYRKYIKIDARHCQRFNRNQLPELPQESHQNEQKVLLADTQVVVAFLASRWTWDLYWPMEEYTKDEH